MKKSTYIIAQNGFSDSKILLYSTRTTSIVELEYEMYDDIFNKENYGRYPEETKNLEKMGFLIEDNFDEYKYLEEIRKKTIKSNASLPTYYIICPTTECNARCYYCFEHGAELVPMKMETADKVADYIIHHHDDNLVLQWFGGEPLLEPEIISHISKKLQRKGIEYSAKIITNGFLLDEEIIKKVKNDWKISTIQITIDDLKNEYNRIKNFVYDNVDAFSVVMNNIESCLKNNLEVRIRINFNPIDYSNVIRITNYLKRRIGKRDNFFVYLAPIDSASKKIPAITGEFKDKEKHPLIALMDAEKEYCSFGNYDSKNSLMSKTDKVLRKYFLYPIPIGCYGGCQSSLTIDAKGNIFACHRLLGREECSSGNVFTGRIENEISRYYSSYKLEDDECKKCALLPICQGGCKYRAKEFGHSYSCTSVKGAIKELIKSAVLELQL